MTGECPNCGVDIDAQAQELDQLRADNERLRGEVEALNDLLKTHKVIENFKSFEKCAKELKAHKAALEKARVALDLFVTTWKLAHPMQRLLVFEECAKDCSDALGTINELLQKGSK